MGTKLGDAKIRIELDTKEAVEALNRLEEKIRNMDSAAGTAPDEKVYKLSGEAKSHRQGGDSASAGTKVRPGMTTTGPGRFGVQNLRSMLSATGALAAVPVVGGALAAGADLSLRYGAAAEGAVSGAMDEGLKGLENSDIPLAKELAAGLKKLVEVQMSAVNKTVREIDSRLRAVEPTLESLISLGKAQLLAGGALNLGYLSEFTSDMYDIQRTLLRQGQDIRDKTLRDVSEAGGAQLMRELLKLGR